MRHAHSASVRLVKGLDLHQGIESLLRTRLIVVSISFTESHGHESLEGLITLLRTISLVSFVY